VAPGSGGAFGEGDWGGGGGVPWLPAGGAPCPLCCGPACPDCCPWDCVPAACPKAEAIGAIRKHTVASNEAGRMQSGGPYLNRR